MLAQPRHDRRRFLGMAALSLGAAWIGTRDSVMHMLTVKPFRPSSASDLASISAATAWLNSPPLTAEHLQGKVVLVDFWTYTCINWLRTLPYVRAWAARYREQGLIVIGVHTPEFTFEEDIDNVRVAAQERGITYPIAIDNNRAIWSGFGNHYWPALYFIDAAGRVRDHHFGEGNYEESEMRIRRLLAAAGTGGGIDRESVSVEAHGPEVGADWGSLKSPETYIGHQKAENFASPGGGAVNTRHVYAVPARLRNLVMGPAARRGAVSFRVLIDGQPPGAGHGCDADEQGNGTVTEQRLYQLIRQSGLIADRQFEIEFLDPGVEAFAFTFG